MFNYTTYKEHGAQQKSRHVCVQGSVRVGYVSRPSYFAYVAKCYVGRCGALVVPSVDLTPSTFGGSIFLALGLKGFCPPF